MWAGWEPGGEFVKKLVVKNVSRKTQTFKFRKAPSATFSLPFSDLNKLSPGMTFTIPVSFRPADPILYEVRSAWLPSIRPHRPVASTPTAPVCTACMTGVKWRRTYRCTTTRSPVGWQSLCTRAHTRTYAWSQDEIGSCALPAACVCCRWFL